MKYLKVVFLIYSFSTLTYSQADNQSCIDARLLFEKDTVTFTQEVTQISEISDCYYFDTYGYWFRIDGDSVALKMSYYSQVNNYVQYVIMSGSCENRNCRNIGFLYNTTSRIFNLVGQEDKYIFITGQGDIVGDKIIFETSAIYNNSSCVSSVPVEDGNDYFISVEDDDCSNGEIERWYSFEGADDLVSFRFSPSNFYQLRIQIFEESCSSNIPIVEKFVYNYRYSQFNLFGSEGTDYTLKIEAAYCSSGLLHFDVLRGERPPNDYCEGAIDISRESMISGNDRMSLDSPDQLCQQFSQTLWYQLEGGDSIINLNGEYNEMEFLSMRFDSCRGASRCIQDDTYEFYAKEGRSYFLQVQSSDRSYKNEVNFTKQIREAVENLDCETSFSVDCGEVVLADFEKSLGLLYYKVLGDDHIWTIGLSEYSGIYSPYNIVSIYTGSCERLTFQTRAYLNSIGENLRFYAEAGQEYFIIIEDVHSIKEQSEFTFECLPTVENNSCEGSLTLLLDSIYSESFEGSTYEYFDNQCSSRSGSDLWYNLIGDGNFSEIEVISLQESYFYIEVYENDCTNLRCVTTLYANSSDNRLTFLTELDKTYFIVFRARNSLAHFDFQFRVSSHIPALNDMCSGALPLQCGQSISDSTYFATLDTTDHPCYTSYPGVWYSFEGNGQVLELTFSSDNSSYISLSVLKDNCDELSCFVKSERLYLSNGDNFYFHTKPGITYYILASGNYNQFATFNLHVSCQDIVYNNECSSAQELTCGPIFCMDNTFALPDSLNGSLISSAPGTWASFEGDGQIYYLSWVSSELRSSYYKIYESDSCDSLQYVEGGYFYGVSEGFLTNVGKTYFLYVYGRDFHDRGETKVSLSCVFPASNNLCTSPIELSCGQEEQMESLYYSSSDSPCNSNYRSGWYTINGNDKINIISFFGSYSSRFSFQIYENTNCDSLSCIGRFNNEFVSFFAEEGRTYLLSVNQRLSYNPSIVGIRLDCYDPAENDRIENALDLSCMESYNLNFLQATSIGDSSCYTSYDRNVLWFAFEGQDKILNLTTSSSNFGRLRVALFENFGNNFDCIHTDYLYTTRSDTFKFATYEGQRYIVGISEDYPNNFPSEYNLQISCAEGILNDLCTDATVLNCQDSYEGSTINMTHDFLRNCGDPRYNITRDAWYKVIGDDQYYELSVNRNDNYSAQFEVYVGSCSGLWCLYSGIDSVIFYAETGSDYFISIDEYYFNINATCFQEIETTNNLCVEASPIFCGEENMAVFEDATLSGIISSCGSSGEPDIWYSIVGTGELLEVEFVTYVNSNTVNVYSGDCENLQCLVSSDRYGRYPPRFVSELGENYYLQVVKGNSYSEDFTFKINCIEPLQNDICEEAIPLICGDSYDTTLDIGANDNINDCTVGVVDPGFWFKFTGDGERYVLDVTENFGSSYNLLAFTGVCNSCDEPYDPEEISHYWFDSKYIFDTEVGEEYYILFAFNRIDQRNRFSFDFYCAEKEHNVDQVSAIELACSDTFDVNIFGGSLDVPSALCNIQPYTLWYSLEGDNKVHDIYPLYDSLDAHQTAFLLQEDDGELICIENVHFVNRYITKMRFYAEEDKSYYLIFSDRYLSSTPKTKWKHECYQLAANDICSNAQRINCSQSLKVLTQGALNDPDQSISCYYQYHSAPTVWYTITGEGLYLSISHDENSEQRKRISLFEGLCEDLLCLESTTLSNYRNEVSFLLEKGKEYFIKISNYDRDQLLTEELQLYCSKPNLNTSCEEAVLLDCGIEVVDSLDYSLASGLEPECTFATNRNNWYSFEGNGDTMTISFLSIAPYFFRVEYFVGTCEGLKCLNYDDLIFTNKGTSIVTRENETYYVRVGDNQNNYSYSIKLLCPDICPVGKELAIIGPSKVCSGDSKVRYFVDYVPGWDYKWNINVSSSLTFDANVGILEVEFLGREYTQIDTLGLTIIDLCGNVLREEIIISTATVEECSLMNCLQEYIVVNEDKLQENSKDYFFKAFEIIYSNGLIQRDMNVIFEAGHEIELLQDFEIEKGATFIASIRDCFE